VTGLTPATTYQFKLQARSAYGLSELSDALQIITAEVPTQPEPPVTVFVGTAVTITWVEPDSMGSPVTGYKVYIRANDDITYLSEYTYCDGSDQTVIDALSCTIPVAQLTGSYFNIEWGKSVFAKVIAYNIYGDSPLSEEGNGAVIITAPDAPLNLAEDASQRGPTQIGLTWTEGASNGGSSVIDYEIYYD
jgi:hypothetical protein